MSDEASTIDEVLRGCGLHRGAPSSHCQACADSGLPTKEVRR